MTNTVETLIRQLGTSPDTVTFKQVIDVINAHYVYTPANFTNGEGEGRAVNLAGTNEGSCRIFGFGKLHGLNEQQTLSCFGDYYRVDVLQHPDGTDHANIRNFMRSGWAGITFDTLPLQKK